MRKVIDNIHVNKAFSHFHIELMFILKVIKSCFNRSFDKQNQNLTLVVILYEIYETRQRLVSLISYEMTTHVNSSI